MTDFPELHCSDELFRSLVEASHCSFILLALHRLDQPVSLDNIVFLLSLKDSHAALMLDMLIHFDLIKPVENGGKFIITPAGIDLISPKPVPPPFQFDPTLQVEGDRLPTYVAFDLLPLRIYSYRLNKTSSLKEDQEQP